MQRTTVRLAVFMPDFNGGGAERAMMNLVNAIAQRPDRVLSPTIIVRRRTGPMEQQVAAGVPVVSLGLARSGWFSSLGTTGRLSRVLAELEPDVLLTVLSLPSVAAAKKLSRRPTRLVVSLQTPLPTSGGPGYFATQLALRACDLVLATAPGLAAQARRVVKGPAPRVELLPNSVDIAAIRRATSTGSGIEPIPRGQGLTIVTMARLAPEKRLDVLLESIAILRRRGRDVRALVLGTGALRENLESLASHLGIASAVHFLGFQPYPWRVVANADLFVLTSAHEGFGNVLVEAMACRVPIICTRVPYGPEYILEDGQAGALVPAGDPLALADEIVRLSGDAAARRTYVERADKRVHDFDIQTVVRRFIDLMTERCA